MAHAVLLLQTRERELHVGEAPHHEGEGGVLAGMVEPVGVGKPWEAISDYAARHGFELVVMGTRGMGSYTGAALGSVAHGVAERSAVPVLLIGSTQPAAGVGAFPAPGAAFSQRSFSARR